MISDEGLIAVDGDDTVLLASARAQALLGPRIPQQGTPFHTSQLDYRILRLVDAAVASGRVEEREIALGDRDLVVRALRVDDADVAVMLTVRDETTLHRLERVRRDFVSNVSHELRTPVTAVRLLAETLENGGLDDPAAAADFVRRIEDRSPGAHDVFDDYEKLTGRPPLRWRDHAAAHRAAYLAALGGGQ